MCKKKNVILHSEQNQGVLNVDVKTEDKDRNKFTLIK